MECSDVAVVVQRMSFVHFSGVYSVHRFCLKHSLPTGVQTGHVGVTIDTVALDMDGIRCG